MSPHGAIILCGSVLHMHGKPCGTSHMRDEVPAAAGKSNIYISWGAEGAGMEKAYWDQSSACSAGQMSITFSPHASLLTTGRGLGSSDSGGGAISRSSFFFVRVTGGSCQPPLSFTHLLLSDIPAAATSATRRFFNYRRWWMLFCLDPEKKITRCEVEGGGILGTKTARCTKTDH